MPPHAVPYQSTRWCFTIFVDVDPEAAASAPSTHDVLAREFKPGVYGGKQLERCPSTSRVHWQGFCVIKDKQTVTGMKKKYSGPHFGEEDKVHWEVMRESVEHSETYCSKEETRLPGESPQVWGYKPAEGRGARNDIALAVHTLKTKGIKALAREHPTEFVKYSGGFLKILPLLTDPDPAPSPTTWREWQETLLKELEGTPDDRKIIWYYDQSGAAGKSTIVRHLVTRAQAIVLEGRLVDMAYTYNGERVVFFDLARTQTEHMDHLYQFAEKLKNGMIHSTKYESRHKYFPTPHVVFLANCLPDYSKWSSDRYDVRTLNPLTF